MFWQLNEKEIRHANRKAAFLAEFPDAANLSPEQIDELVRAVYQRPSGRRRQITELVVELSALLTWESNLENALAVRSLLRNWNPGPWWDVSPPLMDGVARRVEKERMR